ATKLVFLVSDRVFGQYDLFLPGRDRCLSLENIYDRHEAGLSFGPIAGQYLLGGTQRGLRDLQVLIGEDQLPIRLLDRADYREHLVQKHIVFDFRVALGDSDRRFVYFWTKIAQQGLRQIERQIRRVPRVE